MNDLQITLLFWLPIWFGIEIYYLIKKYGHKKD